MADEPEAQEETHRPPLAGAPVFVASNLMNGRVVLDANDIIAMLLTRGKESNSLDAEELCWGMASWLQSLVFGTVQSTMGPGSPMAGTELQARPEGEDEQQQPPPEGEPPDTPTTI